MDTPLGYRRGGRSTDPIARLGALINPQERYSAVRRQRPEDQDLTLESGDVARGEVDDGDHEAADQDAGIGICRWQLCGRATDAARAEVERQLVGRLAGGGKGLDCHDPTHAHVDSLE